MKHIVPVILLLSLLLAGCAPAAPASEPTPAPTQAPETLPPTEAPTEAPTEPSRPAHSTVEYTPEGVPESKEATLIVGDGYSLYIPDDTFTPSYDFAAEVITIRWTANLNDKVSLTVENYEGWSESQIKYALIAKYSRYQWEETEDGVMIGTHPQQKHHWEMTLFPTENGYLAVSVCYPTEAAEGFGVLLQAMLDSFELQ